MYSIGLIVHNLNRWLVIATGLLLVAKTLQRLAERAGMAALG